MNQSDTTDVSPWRARFRLERLSAFWVVAFSVALGAGTALAAPPFGFLPGLLGIGCLFLLVDRTPRRGRLKSACWRAWLFGSGYFLVSLWWVSEAFLVDAEAHGWQAPFAVGFLATGLALLWGAAGWTYQLIRPKGDFRALTFAAVFAFFEWLRGHILTGLPWNLVGELWRAGGAFSQSAAIFGVYGLTFVTLSIFALCALAVAPSAKGRGRFFGPMLGLALWGALYFHGSARLEPPTPSPHGLRVRIVQANVPQANKWTLEAFKDILDRYTRLTAQTAKRRPDVVIWSETAIPSLISDYMAPGTWTRSEVEGSLSPGQVLILGADREEESASGRKDYNSLFVLRRQTVGFETLAIYDKHHLVPFGEYFPVDSLAEVTGLKRLVHVGDGFTPGGPSKAQRPSGLPPFAPMICYESLFPGAIADSGQRASWIVNVSNDAWFGRTSGPWQHLNLASYRAIEMGLPMVRSTPTGVSALIDAFGRPVSQLGQGVEGVIDVDLPARAPATVYYQIGDWPFGVVIIAVFVQSMRASRLLRRAQLFRRLGWVGRYRANPKVNGG